LYKQLIDTGNDSFRDSWIVNTLKSLKASSKSSSLLDVGAGLSPYKKSALDLGYVYSSHDFGGYAPSESTKASGLPSAAWDYPKHDYICDILALPETALEIVELTVYGDYIDLMSQEMGRTFFFHRHVKGRRCCRFS
jgi:hypothetical protein